MSLVITQHCRRGGLLLVRRNVSFSTNAKTANPTSPAPSSFNRWSPVARLERWALNNPGKHRALQWLSLFLKVGRTAVLGVSIFMAGRLYGEADFARDPHAKQKELMLTLLKQQSWQTNGDGEPVAPSIASRTDPSYRQVARVGTRVVLAARDFVEEEIKAREARLKALAKEANRGADCEKLAEEIGEWRDRLRLLKGTWNYIVVKSPVPNAFVSDLSPRNIFVNEGLVKGLQITDDELALVLGHEMSHLLHGHMSERLTNAFVVNLIQLVLLNLLDPFGVSTIFAAGLLAKFASFEQASHSRHNETEADETGLKIAALACFDTHSAPAVFGKLAEMERKARVEAGDTTQRVAGWGDTHPMPKDREGSLIAMSKTINKETLGNCSVLRKKFQVLGLDVHF